MLASPIDADLKQLLQLRNDQLNQYDGHDIADLAHFIIAETGDDLAAIEGVAGAGGAAFSQNFVDGTRLGDPDFTDNFEFVERHGNWFEAVVVLSDSGFGLSLIIPDRDGIDTTLIRLVRDRT